MKRRKINSAFLLLLLGEMLTWSSVGNTTEWESITPGVEKRHVHPTTEAIADSPIFLEGGQHVRPNADYQGRKVAGNTESLPAAHPSEKNLLRHLLEKGVPTEGGAFQPLEKVAFPHDFTKQPTVRGTWHGNAVIMTRHCAPTATPPYRCELMLYSKGRFQVIHRYNALVRPDDGAVIPQGGGTLALDWAGDLDHDGYVDLLMNLSDHAHQSRVVLFLSSRVRNEHLVAKVGEIYLSALP